MTERDQFKVSFLCRCADDGLDARQTLDRIRNVRESLQLEKQALGVADMLISGAKNLFIDTPASIIKNVAPTGLALAGIGAIGIPAGAGMIGGHALARASENDTDADSAKADELIGEYKRLSDQSRRYAAMKTFRDKVLPSSKYGRY